ncbi:MAG: Re/Si-specific NAD(P)(+) transhydrogenase subunit alpha [Alphaproteobacteria bacterium]
MVKIAVLNEQANGEPRVALTPEMAKKYIALGITIAVQEGAGNGSMIPDAAFTAAGADIEKNPAENADILLTVRAPAADMLNLVKESAILIGMLDPVGQPGNITIYNHKRLSAFSLEWLPRISRAQSMDVLSSQSNLAGYRAVIEAVAAMQKVTPMMMTAAGTIVPAKVLVLGAGVAGLQAIATAKRLGAVVSAFDVRPAVKEQVESLGAKFIEVPAEESGEATGGYAREMSEDYKRKQGQLIHETAKKQDIIISTALIPGKPAPELITEAMVKDMPEGSVIVDLAAVSGGNCKLTELDKVVTKHGVTLIGYSNLPGHCAVDASKLYARNLFNFVSTLLLGKDGLEVKWEDELVQGTLICRDGNTTHPQLAAAA